MDTEAAFTYQGINITSIAPNSGSGANDVDAVISGGGFQSGAMVTLEQAGQTSLSARNVVIILTLMPQ